MNSPDIKESDWVPLANTFLENLARREGQEKRDLKFTVSRGATDASIVVSYRGAVTGDDEVEAGLRGDFSASEEMSFDKLATLHR